MAITTARSHSHHGGSTTRPSRRTFEPLIADWQREWQDALAVPPLPRVDPRSRRVRVCA